MLTEKISPRYAELDSWSSGEMIAAMYESQLAAAAAVRGALPAIRAAVDAAVPALQRGGRSGYVGAGNCRHGRVGDGPGAPPPEEWRGGPAVLSHGRRPQALEQPTQCAPRRR